MKKIVLLFLAAVLLLSACSNQQAATTAAVDEYNAAVESYLGEIEPYNDAIAAAHGELGTALEDAQAMLEAEKQALRPELQESLRNAMVAAADVGKTIPEPMGGYKTIEIPDNASLEALRQLAAKAEAGVALVQKASKPDMSKIPDYRGVAQQLQNALEACEAELQRVNQVLAPEDAFVMERLGRIETVTAMDAVTPENDPNQMLNQPGGYIGCIYFSDSRINRKTIDAADDARPIQMGFVGGGAVEIYATVEDAENRDAQLKMFDGTTQHTAGQASYFEPGVHGVIGSIVIRTSNVLTEEQQAELLAQIIEVLQVQ